MNQPELPGTDEAPVEAWANVVLILRRSVMQLCAAGVGIGRLTLFSDYHIEGADWTELVAIDEDLHKLLERMGGFEDRWRTKITKPMKDHMGDSRQ